VTGSVCTPGGESLRAGGLPGRFRFGWFSLDRYSVGDPRMTLNGTSSDIRKLERAEDGALTISPAVSTFFISTKQQQIQAILSTKPQFISNVKTPLQTT
jgi:hypothetical protein